MQIVTLKHLYRLCENAGQDKMRSDADLRDGSPLVSFNHLTDPHCVTFSSSLYTTTHHHEPNSNPNPNRNFRVIINPQIGPRDRQIVTVQIRPADLPCSAYSRVLKSAPNSVFLLFFSFVRPT